jgi:hypothetical protein
MAARNRNRTFDLLALTAAVCLSAAAAAEAQVVRLEITSREPMAGGQPFGAAGPYEMLRGRIHGEVDPADRHNALIQDLRLAPLNARKRVEYVATFALAKPIDMAKASGVLIYTVVNRGNGDAVASADGHVSLVSGWQGDVAPSGANQTIAVPIARQRDGSAITGPVLARFFNIPPGTNTVAIRLSSMGAGPPVYPPATLDQRDASLISAAGEDRRGVKSGVVSIPRASWAFADCRTVPFPGTPDPSRLCVKDGFDPARLYELTYTAKDPLVLGAGLAATRDIVSFFRHAAADEGGTRNPVAGAVRHAIAIGDSQSGNLIKTFVHLGFNQDLAGRMVWDGIFPRIAARQTPIDFRFALPGGAATLYEPGSEGVRGWGRYEDKVRGRQAASLLDRCTATRTCPKVIEAFGSAEFWGLRMSPGLIGTDARADIPLPDNVRRYYYPGTTHGGGRGGFRVEAGPAQPGCVLPANPNPQADTTRALTAALVAWVVHGTPPPPSRYPLVASGDLVAATKSATRFPDVPGLPFADGLVNAMLDYDFGDGLVVNDLRGTLTRVPPRIKQVIPTFVPVVNGDGNETTGVPSVLHQAPLGTYLGWNVTAAGFFKGEGCGFAGGYWPFAKTRADRLASRDPRRSVEERYGTQEGYVCAVRRAVEEAVGDRFLLRADADRLIAEAASSAVLGPDAGSSAELRAIAAKVCGERSP